MTLVNVAIWLVDSQTNNFSMLTEMQISMNIAIISYLKNASCVMYHGIWCLGHH